VTIFCENVSTGITRILLLSLWQFLMGYWAGKGGQWPKWIRDFWLVQLWRGGKR